MLESFLLRSLTFSISGCLELLNRTARVITGHIEEYLDECSRKRNTLLRRQCPGLRLIGVFRLKKVFFIKIRFYFFLIGAITAILPKIV